MAPGVGAPAPSVYDWIEAAHDAWTGVTYAEFYVLLGSGTLRREQWGAYCAELDGALRAAAHPAAAWLSAQGAAAGRTPSGAGTRLAAAVEEHSAAAWTLKVALYQAWRQVRQHTRLHGVHAEAAAMLSGDVAAHDMTLAADLLDAELRADTAAQRHAAKKAFDGTVKLLVVVLENATLSGDEASAVLCNCGRPGHLQAQCTFKSTLAPK